MLITSEKKSSLINKGRKNTSQQVFSYARLQAAVREMTRGSGGNRAQAFHSTLAIFYTGIFQGDQI